MIEDLNVSLLGLTIATSGLTSLGLYFLSAKPLTARLVIGTVFIHGPLGGWLGAYFYDFDAFGKSVIRAGLVAAGYGAGVVSIKAVFNRIFPGLGDA